MRLDRVMIAAPKSGSGKTTLTCGLLQLLKERGIHAVSYKCGPDYIDPMFHRRVLHIPSENLDTFFTGETETKRLFLQGRSESDFAVLEGVMGLYDGLGGVREEGSSYHLARVTGTPIILVVDAKGMGRSVIPLIAGFLAYDKEKLIRGVILNRTSEAYCRTIKPLIESELPVCVAGCLPDDPKLQLNSRHLGLVMPDEIADIRTRLGSLSEKLKQTVSLEKIIRIAESADEITDLEKEDAVSANQGAEKSGKIEGLAKNAPVIAVARDEAFCFYYEENLRLLEKYGAKPVFFSPIRDKRLPEDCSALLLGGGYPELYAKELADNEAMRMEIRKAVADGMPTVAECGGFLYLHSLLQTREGGAYQMAGVFSANCYDVGKTVRFGYIELEEKEENFLPKGEKIRGHEFHYYDSGDNGADCLAIKPVTGKTYSCCIDRENQFLGFPHLYYPSNPSFAERFVEKAGRYAGKNKNP